MHIKAEDFKSSIEKYLTLVSIVFTLKPEFCSKVKKGSFFSTYPFVPSDEGAIQFLNCLRKLRFGEFSYNQPLPFITKDRKDISESTKLVKYLEAFFYQKLYGVNFRLFCLSRKIEELRSVNEEIVSNPTVLISGGNGGLYIFYKTLAALYLIRGLDVIMADFRGYGTSTGTPTAYNTKLDLETIYQYLSKEENVENKDILLHAHCLGAGSATDLAARRHGVNIVVDRSFAHIGGLMKTGIFDLLPHKKCLFKEISQIISKSVAELLNCTVTYDNATNLSKIKGNVAIVRAVNDEIIIEEEAKKQINSREEKTVIYTSVGHNNLWIASEEDGDNKSETEALNQFLIDINLYRRVFELASSEPYCAVA